MAYDDKDGVVFPTRSGDAQGSAFERVMLDKVGAGSIATRVTKNTDGDTVLLKTRNGFPHFSVISETGGNTTDTELLARGFLAAIAGGSSGNLFSPYTLGAIKAGVTPAWGKYNVLANKSGYGVREDDTTNFNDVLTVTSNGAYINRKSISPSGIVKGAFGIPVMLNSYTATTTGDLLIGYAGPYSAGTPDGTALAMGGSAYRPNSSLTCGQRVVGSSAYTMQIAFTQGAFDALYGSWIMHAARFDFSSATSPQLTKTTLAIDSSIPSCAPQKVSANTSKTSSKEGLPACVGGVLFNPSYSIGTGWLVMKATAYDVFRLQPIGTREVTNSSFDYSNSKSGSFAYADKTCSYSLSISVKKSAVANGISWEQQYFTLCSGSGGFAYASPGGSYQAPITPANYGERGVTVRAGAMTYGDGGVDTKTYEGSANISFGNFSSISLSFKKIVITTTKVETKENNWAKSIVDEAYNPWPAKAYWWAENVSAQTAFQAFADASCATGPWYNVNDIFHYGSDVNGPWMMGSYCAPNWEALYTQTVTETTTTSDYLSVTTRDYILHDEENSVYIYLVGTISGSGAGSANGSTTVSVKLVLETPAGSGEKNLYGTTLTYADILPFPDDLYLTDTAQHYVPLPELRAFFTPKFRHQGAFFGAAYTTAAEVASGASPAYLFNFSMTLGMLSSIGGTEEEGAASFSFVPMNFLHMLYMYVFDSNYGDSETTRYPVNRLTAYNTIAKSILFKKAIKVYARNGAITDWKTTVDVSYAGKEDLGVFRV